MKNIILSTLVFLFSIPAFAAQIRVMHAPNWTIETITKPSTLYAVSGAEAVLTLPTAGGPSQPVFIKKLPTKGGLPKSIQQWSDAVVQGRNVKINNEKLITVRGKQQYIVEYEFQFSQEVLMKVLTLATEINGEVYSIAYSMNEDEFKVHSPEVAKLFRTVELYLE